METHTDVNYFIKNKKIPTFAKLRYSDEEKFKFI